MRQSYGYNDFLVIPDDLYAFAWSAPMRDLAAKLDLSDVGLKKILASYGVSPPPQGYWNKVRAGKPIPKRPSAPPRRPGEIGRLRLDARFAKVLSETLPLPSNGPFASQSVPEDLDELFALELRAIGRVSVPKTLDRPYKGLLDLLKQEQRRRDKAAESNWHWDQPKFDTPLARRRLRILNAILWALSKRGHGGDAYEHDGEMHARALVGDTGLGMAIEPAGRCRTVRQQGHLRPAPDLPASTPLMLRLDPGFNGKNVRTWQDDNQGTLEARIASIAASIIVAGETQFRQSLREAEEHAERQRLEQEKRRLEWLAELNRQRVQHLRASGELLRQAQDIRALVELVRQAIIKDHPETDTSMLAAWENWALTEADRIDPIRSGQFMIHFREPEL